MTTVWWLVANKMVDIARFVKLKLYKLGKPLHFSLNLIPRTFPFAWERGCFSLSYFSFWLSQRDPWQLSSIPPVYASFRFVLFPSVPSLFVPFVLFCFLVAKWDARSPGLKWLPISASSHRLRWRLPCSLPCGNFGLVSWLMLVGLQIRCLMS